VLLKQTRRCLRMQQVRFLRDLNEVVPKDDVDYFVALVLDKQTNGAQLNSEDVFKNTIAAAATAANPVRNLLFANRFQVLKEWRGTLTPPAVSFDGTNMEVWGSSERIECFIPMDLPVNFNSGTTASVANVIDNSLHMIAFCNGTGLAANLHYNARIRFMG